MMRHTLSKKKNKLQRDSRKVWKRLKGKFSFFIHVYFGMRTENEKNSFFWHFKMRSKGVKLLKIYQLY
jgi:hypothetical protein